jgi:hypothetical protein
VDDDTVSSDCHVNDVFVQPGTNHYLVTAICPYWLGPGNIDGHAYLYRSTDQGRSFQPGVQLDTFIYNSSAQVVADAQHVICDYTGNDWQNNLFTQARTLFAPADTWGPCSPVTDTTYSSYNSCDLALSADGWVHTALNVQSIGHADVCYSFSTDHGSSWAETERVNDDTLAYKQNPAIAADSAGYVYVAWEDSRNDYNDIWFSTNSPAGIAESRVPQDLSLKLSVEPSVFRNAVRITLDPSSPRTLGPSPIRIFDAAGRLVRTVGTRQAPVADRLSHSWDGYDEIGRRCAPGAYLVCAGGAVAKVIVLPAQ